MTKKVVFWSQKEVAVKITGEDLKSMRLKTGLSQREVAKAMSISHSS